MTARRVQVNVCVELFPDLGSRRLARQVFSGNSFRLSKIASLIVVRHSLAMGGYERQNRASSTVPKPSSRAASASSTDAQSPARVTLPNDLSGSLKYLDDAQLQMLLQAVIALNRVKSVMSTYESSHFLTEFAAAAGTKGIRTAGPPPPRDATSRDHPNSPLGGAGDRYSRSGSPRRTPSISIPQSSRQVHRPYHQRASSSRSRFPAAVSVASRWRQRKL